jgi:hypothetical protein
MSVIENPKISLACLKDPVQEENFRKGQVPCLKIELLAKGRYMLSSVVNLLV